VSLHTRLRGFTNGKLRRRWILLSLKGDLNSMNTHTVRRHVKELALRQQIGKDDQVFLTSHRLRILFTSPSSLVPVNLQLQLREKRMISLKASPKGEEFCPIPQGDINHCRDRGHDRVGYTSHAMSRHDHASDHTTNRRDHDDIRNDRSTRPTRANGDRHSHIPLKMMLLQ
ncbi:MAG: hypothetical protein ACM3TN_08050, partial [Alphaproteobacteria bacterium]